VGSAGTPLAFQATNLTANTSGANGAQFLSATGAVSVTGADGLNAGGGVVTLAGGTFTLSTGTSVADASNVVVNSPAVLGVSASGETVGSLAGTGTVTVAGGTLTTGGSGTSTTFSRTLGGAGNLTKQGGSPFTRSGNNPAYGGS